MFSLREFVKKGFLDAVGKQPDFWIRLNASGWYRDGVLTTEDLAEINTAIDEKNTPPVVEEEAEEIVEE